MGEGRAFDLMLDTAREWLSGRDMAEIARNAGANFDGQAGALRIYCLGREYEMRWPELKISPHVQPWLQLVMLHYLHTATGAPLTGELMNFGALPGGLARGGDFDRSSAAALGKLLGPQRLEK